MEPPDGPGARSVIDIAVEPGTAADGARLQAALREIVAEDRALRVRLDEESGQAILGGLDELHLDAVVDRLLNEFGIAAHIGAPQVAYRETITRSVDHDYTHKKQLAGSGEFARIKFRIEPIRRGAGFEFISLVGGGNIPSAYMPAVRDGVTSVAEAGPIIGFPVVDVKFILLDGAYHDIDSSAAAFEAAGRAGFREAIEKARPRILEPIMAIEVIAPLDCAAGVARDLKSRRAEFLETESRGLASAVRALAPLASMFGYDTALRGLTGGRGEYEMAFSHYAEVPADLPDGDGPYGGAMAMRA
jgi:elongation factor G